MATLQHVSRWKNEHGWQHTTPEEAANEFTHSMSNKSQLFMCESCGQYATFINGANIPHFKHPRGSKYCEEKITSFNNYRLSNPYGFSLPLKIIINNNSLELLIGFLPMPGNLFSILQEKNSKLLINNDGKVLRQFLIDGNRFSPEQITYLSIGDSIAKEYLITYPDIHSKIKFYWPTVVNGIDPKGTIFDYDSGKRLPQNANVLVGKAYLLIIKKKNNSFSRKDLTITKEYSYREYNVFKIIANRLSRSADEFFRCFNCRLTDNAATLTLLYPFSASSSHVIRHTEYRAWFHKTNGFIDVYPNPNLQKQASTAGIFPVFGEQLQLISVSRFEQRTSVLRYTILKKVDYISEKTTSLSIKVFDNQNNLIEGGIHSSLPQNRELHIVVEYDGFVELTKNEIVINKILLKSDTRAIIDVDYGSRFRIYQGLDCCYEIYFYRHLLNGISDEDLLMKLQSYKNDIICVRHSIHALSKKLNKYPKSKLWLRSQIKHGKIDKKALKRISEVK